MRFLNECDLLAPEKKTKIMENIEEVYGLMTQTHEKKIQRQDDGDDSCSSLSNKVS